MDPLLTEELLSEAEIKARIKEMGAALSRDYRDKDPLLLGVLRGAAVFLADLARELTVNAVIDLLVVTRYGYKDKPGQLRIIKDLNYPIEGKDVLIVEDIIDEGLTLFQLREALLLRRPASLKICTLFDKPCNRKVSLTPDYSGFTIPDQFIVGYGLDYKQKFRNLPYLAAVKEGV